MYSVNYLTFEKDLGEKHNVNVVVGMEFNETERIFTSITGNEFPSDDFQTITSAAEITAGQGSFTEYNFLSYFARATYIFDNKYFIKGSIRRDGFFSFW